MAYKRKTHDEYIVFANYGYGWEEIDRYATRKECAEAVKAYRVNKHSVNEAWFTWKRRMVKNDERAG